MKAWIWLRYGIKMLTNMPFKAKQILRKENVNMFGRTVHVSFITFLDPLESFSYRNSGNRKKEIA